MEKLTAKQKVMKKYPTAELAKDGWDEKAGPSGCYDFAIFLGDLLIATGSTARNAWAAAARRLA